MSIIHIDLDAFFVSVEQAMNPALRGKPVIVGGNPDCRGVVSSASYEARSHGVRAGMPLVTARRLCPQATFIKGDLSRYFQISERFMDILRDNAQWVEASGIDEAYMDVTRDKPAREIALVIKNRIKGELCITASAGIADSKVIAKIASDLGKPDGLLEVASGEERSFLAPLPASKLPGVGKKTERILAGMGITTIGQLAAMPLPFLKQALGVAGETLHCYANGIDESKVEPVSVVKSVSREITFAEDTADTTFLQAILHYLSEQVGSELRGQNKQGKCITLKLRYADFQTITRSCTLKGATGSDHTIFESGNKLLDGALSHPQKLVRLIGIRISNLTGFEQQLSLTDSRSDKLEQVGKAVDRIRQKYGFASIKTGRTLTVESALSYWDRKSSS